MSKQAEDKFNCYRLKDLECGFYIEKYKIDEMGIQITYTDDYWVAGIFKNSDIEILTKKDVKVGIEVAR